MQYIKEPLVNKVGKNICIGGVCMCRTKEHKWLCLILILSLLMGAQMSLVKPVLANDTLTYYIDALDGDDENSGTTESEAWQSLDKLNAMTFQPGTKILFKAGGIWNGAFIPKGSGSEGAPIIVDQYGEGPRPILNGNGVEATIHLINEEYWEFHNLEITNSSSTKDLRKGIFIQFKDKQNYTFNHYYINNCYIHDVTSRAPDYHWGDPWEMGQYSGGILTRMMQNTCSGSSVNDIRYTNNRIENVDKVGMKFQGFDVYATNVVVTDNYIKDTHGDGVNLQNQIGTYFAHNTIINAKWNVHPSIPGIGVSTWKCNNALIEYNSIHDTHNTADGQAIDFDGKSYDCIAQYNYTSNNDGGFWLACAGGEAYPSNNAIVRYNISQNDKDCLVQFRTGSHNSKVYNNTFYTREGMTGPTFLEKPTSQGDAEVFNNIWVNLGTANNGPWEEERITYSNNLFYGNFTSYPNDPYLIKKDPKFSNPNTGTKDWDSVTGYQLLNTSPAINAGREIANNGGKDYWGNDLYYGLPDIGAHEFQGEPVIIVPDPGIPVELDDYFNNDGFSYDSNPSDGNYDHVGYSYSAELVGEEVLTFNDVEFQLGDFTDGVDNVIDCDNQIISLPSEEFTSIHMLGSSTRGNKSGDFILTYSDGSTSNTNLSMTDWCYTNGTIVKNLSHRHRPSGDVNTKNYIFLYTLIPETGKTVTSIQLPEEEDMHIIAITLLEE